MKFWQFLQDQLLGMKWLNALIGCVRRAKTTP